MSPEKSSNLLETIQLAGLRAETCRPLPDSKASAYSRRLEKGLKIASRVGEDGEIRETSALPSSITRETPGGLRSAHMRERILSWGCRGKDLAPTWDRAMLPREPLHLQAHAPAILRPGVQGLGRASLTRGPRAWHPPGANLGAGVFLKCSGRVPPPWEHGSVLPRARGAQRPGGRLTGVHAGHLCHAFHLRAVSWLLSGVRSYPGVRRLLPREEA